MPRSALVAVCLLATLACRPSNAGMRDAEDAAADALEDCNQSASACAPDVSEAASLNDDAEDVPWACGDAGVFGEDAGSGAVNWAMSFGKTGVISPGPPAIDPTTGEIAVVGTSPFGSADFGAVSVSNNCPPTPLEAGTSATCGDLFVARFDACGVAKWAKMIGSGGTTSPVLVATRSGGETIVGGQLLPGASVDFGCGPLPTIGGTPFFIAAFSDAGSCLFSKGFGSSNDPNLQSLTALAVDADGNVLLAGEMTASSPIDFGGGPVGGRTFIVKLGPDGSHLWSQALQVYSEGPTIAVSPKGEAVLAATVVPQPDAERLSDGATSLHSEVALFKYDAAGNEVWSRVFDDAAERAQIRESGVAVDPLGNVALLGSFSGAAVDFGMGLLTPGINGAAFLVSLDPAGGAIWRKAFQPVNADIYPSGIAADSTGGVTITASFSPSAPDGGAPSINFGGGSLPATSTAVAHFDSTGAYRWAYAPQPSSNPGGAWATLSGVAVARTTLVVAGGFGEACPGASICQTSPDGVTLSLPGKAVTATSATDTFLASFGL